MLSIQIYCGCYIVHWPITGNMGIAKDKLPKNLVRFLGTRVDTERQNFDLQQSEASRGLNFLFRAQILKIFPIAESGSFFTP